MLTLLVVFAVAVIGAAGRRRDVAVLYTVGFSRRQVSRALIAETAGPAVVATLLGGLAGTVATCLTAERLPLRATSLPPAGVPVGPWAVTVVIAVAAVSILIISFAATATIMRHKGFSDEVRRR